MRVCIAAAIICSTGLVSIGPASATLPNWLQQSPGAMPSDRFGAAMAYDASTHDVVLFGGSTNNGGYLSDTWIWDGSTWAQQSPSSSPPPRYDASMAYDPATHDLVLFGGYNSGEPFQRSDTWLWDGTTWTQANPATSPPNREGASMVFDQATNNVVLFGGYNGFNTATNYSDTWTWDGSTWTEQHPATSPTGRYEAAMAYVPVAHNVVLFGGGDGQTETSDTWVWDGTNWKQKFPIATPALRQGAALANDPSTGYAVMFGGTGGQNGMPDTWIWDGTAWTMQLPATTPAGRTLASIADDPATNNVVLFGGSTPPALADTWTWHGFAPARTISIAPSPLPAVAGPVDYAVTVTGVAAVPTGSVSVSDGHGGSCVSLPLNSSGTAHCSMSESAAAPGFQVTATYSGDTTYPGGTSAIVVSGGVSSGGTATATVYGLSATATGGSAGNTITAGFYQNQPVNAPSFQGGSYLDVALSSPNSFTSVTMTFCSTTVSSTNTFFWWDPSTQTFLVVNPQPTYTPPVFTIPPTPPCLSDTFNATTTPSLTQLTGTVFGVAQPTAPSAPRAVSAAPGNQQANVHWTKPLSNGGKPISGYTVTAYLAGVAKSVRNFGPTTTTAAMTGLTNTKRYAFRVVAKNTVGTGVPSAASNAVLVGAPNAPTAVVATAGTNQATLRWHAPSATNGAPITAYVITPYKNGVAQAAVTFNKTDTTETVKNLASGRPYRFTIAAKNSRGIGVPSAKSNAVAPT
jgi:hypothetical protein